MTVPVFDIGNVLVKWDPRPAFRRSLGCDAEVEAFLERTDFFARNSRADRGERFGALASEIADPDDRLLFSTYVDRFALTVQHPIDATWRLLQRLRRRDVPVHAITNWSAETWPIGMTLHPRLNDAFDVTIVSGKVRMAKPDRAIFDLLCRRAGIPPESCLFIDDSPENIAGAAAAGWQTHLFTAPEALEADLGQRGLL